MAAHQLPRQRRDGEVDVGREEARDAAMDEQEGGALSRTLPRN